MTDMTELNRLKRVVLSDNMNVPSGVTEVLKEDVKELLSGYAELEKDGLSVTVELKPDGIYEINVDALARSIKSIKSF